jgi:hypothetical protein
MEILISFSTSVGVVTASKITKDIAVDVVNHSIVLSVKNIKTPHPAKPGENLNNRSINYTTPPDSYYGDSGFIKFLYVNEYRTDYRYDTYSPGNPWRIIEVDVDTTPRSQTGVGFRKVKVTYYLANGSVSSITEYEEDAWGLILKYCGGSSVWGGCSYNSGVHSDGSYFNSFYSASVKYLVFPL